MLGLLRDPTELFAGRRTRPHDLFGRDDVEVYLDHLDRAIELELRELGDSGTFEIFALTRRLAHRMGLASWGGIEAAAPARLNVLAPLFDRLDSSESFVHPARAFVTIATRKRADEKTRYEIPPGVFVATMMSVTNTTAAPGLDRFDPERYRGAVLREAGQLPARELVTTFGHGRHYCPAQRFSTSAIRRSLPGSLPATNRLGARSHRLSSSTAARSRYHAICMRSKIGRAGSQAARAPAASPSSCQSEARQ